MRSSRRLGVVRATALGILCIPLLGDNWPQQRIEPTSHRRPFVPHWSPSVTALMESQRHWIQAWNAIGEEQAQLEAWDPAAVSSSPSGELAGPSSRRELVRAYQFARRALALSQSETETYRSIRWLARIECALGDHEEELRLAKRLASLAAGDVGSLTCLIHAAHCNGLTELEKQAIAALNRRSGGIVSHRDAVPGSSALGGAHRR